MAVETALHSVDDIRRDIAADLDLPSESIGLDDDLLRLGLDSIGVMRLVARWRRAGVEITFAELVETRTLAEWWALLSSRLPGATGDPAAGHPPAPSEVRPSPAAPDGAGGRPGAAEPPEVDERAPFPLATMQHAYWAGRQDGAALGGVGAHFYNEFDGAGVDPGKLEAAVRALTRRHPMLRAAIEDGVQRILPDSPWPGLSVFDLRDRPPSAVEEELRALRDRLSHRRLRVARGEVFDVALSLLPGGRTRTHVQTEMLVADAQSFRILLADLAHLYEHPDEPLPPLRLSYPRYLAALAGGRVAEREAAREYWARRLPELPGGPELPLAADPCTVAGHRTESHGHWLRPEQAALLAERARTHGLTPTMVFLTAYAEVLAAYSAAPRFLLNLPLYDRQPVHPDVDRMVGEFTNLLLLEVDASRPLGFAARATALQERLRADTAHAAYTGLDVLRELTRSRGGEPVAAPVVFTSALSLGELFSADVRRCFGAPVWTMSQTPQVWLDCQVTEREGGLFLNWDCVPALFPPGLVAEAFEAYRRLLERLLAPAADWSAPVGDLLPEAARRTRAAAGRPEQELPSGEPAGPRLLHEDFFAHAAAAPERTALCWGTGGELTYGALAARAERLAVELRQAGVAPGDSVGITLPKGPEQVVAALGVLRAGAVYVPVAVDQPRHRRERIHATARIRVVVTRPGLAGIPDGCRIVEPPDGPHDAGPLPPLAARTPEDPAYTLFTSGSTGEPKGVDVPHRAARNTIDALRDRFGIGPDDRVLAVSALEFDLSVFDIFAPLSVGGAIVLVGERERRDARRFVELVTRHRVTIWQSVPALLDMLLVAAREEGTRLPLRLALLGGDWVGVELVDRLAEAAPGAVLVGLGGTTETAIHSTVMPVPRPAPAHWTAVPYGVPLRGQALRVVDPLGRDRPDWVPGELWIGGASVAAGYRGDPERTARQFVTHGGARWYRTGDLARYWPDGTVEFLGRADFQVKVNGHRIELGEVEAALAAHPAVRRAVAVAVGADGRRRLAAAVTLASDTAVEPERIAAVAAERVPAYMVPTRIVPVERIPLSANGKVDRAAVERLIESERAGDAAEPPRGETEELVARIWADLLGVARVGRDDSFFALGGDSLVATRLIGRLRAEGYAAGLPAIFRGPTLRDFAATLTRATGTADTLRADPDHRYEPFPATDVQRAYLLGRADDFTLGGVGSHWYWEFDGVDVDLARLEDAVNALIDRHDMLRAVFGDDGRQRVLPQVPRYRIRVGHGEAELARLRERLATRIPDPSRWPLVEIEAVRYGGDRTRLAFSFDYIVLDALSIVVFFAELAARYRDPAAPLPPIGVTFRDYVLGAQVDQRVRAADERFWLDRLDQLPPAPALPLAKDPAAVKAPRFSRREDRLSPAQWRAITERARRHDLTPATVLAAAFAEVLSAWSARDELTLNLTMFNRRPVHPDIDRVLGDFTSLLLAPYRARPGEGWLETVRRMHRETWEGLDHGSVSALWVLRELARRSGAAAVGMPVVFTSALGVAGDLVDLSFPFGEQVWGISQTPQVWLDNQVMERDGGLAFNWDAVDELFADGVLDAMFDAYRRLLRWLADSDWTQPVPDLLPAAQAAVRQAVNATGGPLPDGTLHAAFFARARREPERPALYAACATVSYGELADRALRIAAALAEAGVRPGEPVAVTLPRGPEQIAAVLGVLAAGGAYLPVGVDQPPARRARILARAGARLAVARPNPAGGADGVRVVDPAGGAPLPEPVPVPADQLAYTIFTSGSTGEPKGVEITHRAALNTIVDINQRYGVGPDDRVLAVSALDFDLSVYDIFGLLGAGGALVLIDDAERREAHRFAELVRAHGVTVWNSVPALLDMLLVAAGDGPLPLRLALASGDWVGLDLPGRLRERAPEARFVALGGATEAAIWSNACEVDRVPEHWRSVPYGRPLRNQRYRVVDPRGRDCPDWVPGELWIGGAGVALGYRNDPEITGRQFVTRSGQRWYRTGDLGRYWPDGTLEFLGRADFQVKIRGHRIELGEIETSARAYPGVERAVAFTVGEGAGRQLALAVVGEGVAGAALSGHLAARLPAYMVPERVAVVGALPLSANGKVDRRRLAGLPELAGTGTEAPAAEPPAGDTEKLLADLWSELLEQDQVGRRDSFFALGGDSLLATRLVEELRRRHGVVVALRELFAAPTVARLAAVLDERFGRVGTGLGTEDVEEGTI